MDVGFGLVSAQRTAGDKRTWTDLYREALDLTQTAERLGFATIWTTEHHFIDDGYMPSLLPVSAAMAAVTDRIDIGTGVLLAPMYHPLRLAEDAATVSLIAEGRFILGLGLGWSQIEFDALGADRRTRGRAMSEILSILRHSHAGEMVRHHGSVYDLPEVAVRPVPDSPPKLIVGGAAEPAVRRAAREADGFFSNVSPARFAQQVEFATDEMARHGRDPDTFGWYYYAVVYPSDDPELGWSEIRDHAWGITWKYSDMQASAHRPTGIADPPPLEAEMEERLRRRVIVGTPEEIAARLKAISSQVGVDVNLMLRAYYPRMSYTRQVEVMEELAETIPLLQ